MTLFDEVLDEDAAELVLSWASQPVLDDPKSGRVEGIDAFRGWVEKTRRWLTERGASVRPVDRIATSSRTVEEVELDLLVEGSRRRLPVALAADSGADGKLTAVRIYHSMWP